MITEKQFKSLSPKMRGYMVYMRGARDDEPNVPNETNPFKPGSTKYILYQVGQNDAVIEAQDSP